MPEKDNHQRLVIYPPEGLIEALDQCAEANKRTRSRMGLVFILEGLEKLEFWPPEEEEVKADG